MDTSGNKTLEFQFRRNWGLTVRLRPVVRVKVVEDDNSVFCTYQVALIIAFNGFKLKVFK